MVSEQPVPGCGCEMGEEVAAVKDGMDCVANRLSHRQRDLNTLHPCAWRGREGGREGERRVGGEGRRAGREGGGKGGR